MSREASSVTHSAPPRARGDAISGLRAVQGPSAGQTRRRKGPPYPTAWMFEEACDQALKLWLHTSPQRKRAIAIWGIAAICGPICASCAPRESIGSLGRSSSKILLCPSKNDNGFLFFLPPLLLFFSPLSCASFLAKADTCRNALLPQHECTRTDASGPSFLIAVMVLVKQARVTAFRARCLPVFFFFFYSAEAGLVCVLAAPSVNFASLL